MFLKYKNLEKFTGKLLKGGYAPIGEIPLVLPPSNLGRPS
jgi:hypothetical protein